MFIVLFFWALPNTWSFPSARCPGEWSCYSSNAKTRTKQTKPPTFSLFNIQRKISRIKREGIRAIKVEERKNNRRTLATLDMLISSLSPEPQHISHIQASIHTWPAASSALLPIALPSRLIYPGGKSSFPKSFPWKPHRGGCHPSLLVSSLLKHSDS